MVLASGTRLGPYEILAPLGAGGMGEVYRARDKKLDRDVAIKVLPESVAADPETLARFEREAKAVAALSHPNILSIFDFGAHDGIAYAVMELLEGETLRGKLDAGPVPQKQSVDYALQIAKGLSAAHEKGVVHRDLKPENLFVAKDGHLKILDFGLARRFEAVAPGEETSAPTVSRHTEPGTVMGTVGYMSPEQVRGLLVDHRSDIFSFGTILYELLSGKRAFNKDTAADTMSAILNEDPPELSESGRKISPALDHIVRHCLEKDRDNRFQSARDVAFNLSEQSSPTVTSGAQFAAPPIGRRRVLFAVAAILVLAVAGIFLLRPPHKTVGEAGGLKRVAVLPFENLGSPDDDYFADGMADAVRGKLTSLPRVQVIARGSSTPYKKTTKTPKQIAQELEVRYLLTATVRWQKGAAAASRVEVSPELVEISGTGAPTSRWQQPFDAALTDVFQVQSDIASRVAQALGVALGAGDEKRLLERPTQNLAAYDAFLKGEEATNSLGISDMVGLRKALSFYEQAVALDPGFAQAWAQVSRAYSFLYFFGVPTPDLAERAKQAAEKALALAPDRPEGHLALGAYERAVVGDSNRALEEFAKGQRVAPANAELVRGTAVAEQALGRWEAAVEHFSQAEQLDPRSVGNPFSLGGALLSLQRYPEAREALDRGLALAPANVGLIEGKAMTFLAQGDLAGSRAVLKAAPKEVEPTALVARVANVWDLVWVLDEGQRELLLRLTPGAFDDDRGIWALCLAQAYVLKADAANVRTYAEEARKSFEQQLRAAPEHAVRHAELGIALAYLGRRQEAIHEGERAVALLPVTKDATFGPYLQHQLVRIYMLVGEPEKALDQLEPLLKIPYFLSPRWLKIDPNFDPLRGNARFQKLVARAK
jgi:serine/threonine protein kinase/tetratricopeptide (TPR) repeat protein